MARHPTGSTVARRLAAALTGLCLLTAAACSGASPTTRPAAASPPPTVLPTQGGDLQIAAAGPVSWLDDQGDVTPAAAELSRLSSRQLTSYDGVDSLADREDPRFDLAAYPDVSDDKLSVKFRLRSVEYAPPLTSRLRAADVVFGLQLLCDPNAPTADGQRLGQVVVGFAAFCRGLLARPRGDELAVRAWIDAHPVPGLIAQSDQELEVKLLAPTGTLLNVLAEPDTTPFPESAFDPAAGRVGWSQAPSLGPYVRTTTDAGFEFTRNPHWDATEDPLRRAYLDRIVVTDVGATAAVSAALADGRAELALTGSRATGGVRRTSPSGDLVALVPTRTGATACSRALADGAVRRAVAIGLDRRPVVAAIAGSQSVQWPLPPGVLGYTRQPPEVPVGPSPAPTSAAGSGPSATSGSTAGADPGDDGDGSDSVDADPPAGAVGAAVTPGGAGDPARAAALLAAVRPSLALPLRCTVSTATSSTGVPDPALAGALARVPAALAGAGVQLTLVSGPADLDLVRLTTTWRGDSAGQLLAPVLPGAGPVVTSAAASAEAENDQTIAAGRWSLVAALLVQQGEIWPVAEDSVSSVSSAGLRNFQWFGLAGDADLANLALG